MRSSMVLTGLFAALSSASPARAAKIQVSEDTYLDAKLLLQATGQLSEDGAPSGTAWGKELYLRRGRIILTGKATKYVAFFFDTDLANWGKNEDFSASMYIQDAFGTFIVSPALMIDAGLILVPFSHQGGQSAVSLLTVDYHSALMRYPAGSNKVWRDGGVQLRGLLLKDRVQYRIGAFNGVRGGERKDASGKPLPSLNPNDDVRFAGSLRFNVFDPEPDAFYSGLYFGKKKVLSFGLGGDLQNRAVAAGAQVSDYHAGSADVFLDLPLNEKQELISQVAVMGFHQAPGAAGRGTGAFGELGFRHGAFGGVIAYERFWSQLGNGDYEAYRLDGAWWLQENAANLKAEVASEKDAAAQKVADLAAAKRHLLVTLQAQVCF